VDQPRARTLTWPISLALLALASGIVGCHASAPIQAQPASPEYDAVVDARFIGHDGERSNGMPTFHTIGAALDGAPEESSKPYVIFIHKGRYHEKLSVDKPHIVFLGESRDSTILTYDATADTPEPGGGTYGVRGSFTLRITATDFLAEHLSIENAFNFRGNAVKLATDSTKVKNTQAVALYADGGSDRAAFVDCVISGWQDTLYANAGRAYFLDCVVMGNVDFIFGAGTAVFDDCDIVSRGAGYITAPSTPPLQRYGFVFVGSHLRREANSVRPQTVALGRPWHPSSTPDVNPSAVFIDCDMDDQITAAGWAALGGYEPSTARFFEYKSHGVGVAKAPTRRLLTEDEARPYAVSDVLGGWTP
jgi:pectinesterase